MLWHDFKFGWRMLAKSRGTTTLALLALGLGIGANTAVFSIADGMLLHPLSFRDSDHLAVINAVMPDQSGSLTSISPANFYDWQREQTSFAELSPWKWYFGNLTGSGEPESIRGAMVAPNYFPMLGVQPLLGRGFAADESTPGHDRVVVLSKGLWEKHFAASPAAVGSQIELDGQAYTVVGVMNSDGLEFLQAQLWMPLALDAAAQASRTDHSEHVWGRTRGNVTMAEAQAEFSAFSQRAAASHPTTDRGWGVRVRPLKDWSVGDETASYILMLFGAAAFVLLIACANVANLQFARGIGREHELAIRAALGAGRWPLLRQMFAESLLLGLGGTLVGLAFGWWWIRLILAYMPADVAQQIAGWNRIHLQGRALGFTLLAGLAAALLSGVAPAWSASRPNLNQSLREGARGASGGRGKRRLRNGLVVAQLALALMLLIGAGLMVRGFGAVTASGAQFDPNGVLTASLTLPNSPAYKTAAARAAFYQRTLAQLQALPGVEAAATADMLPLADNEDSSTFQIEGQPTNADHPHEAWAQPVSAGFFPLLRISLLQGRLFNASDGAASQPVALVSRQFAHTYLVGGALGQHILVGDAAADNPWLTIIGVVGDVPYDSQTRLPHPIIYQLAAQAPSTGTNLLLRGNGDVYRYSDGMRRAVAGVDAEQPISATKTLAEVIRENNLGLAYVAVMMTVAGLIALVLAGVGVYAVMAFAVGERTREIGVRMAMGAGTRQVLALIFRGGALLLFYGVLLGLPLAYLLARVLTSLLYGISPGDPLTFVGTTAVLVGAALLACYFPALRASRVDPLEALREQ